MAFPLQRRLAITTATVVLAALALPALAQQPAPAAPAAAATEARPAKAAQAGERREHRERHQARHAQRQADLKAQLQLTPAQEPAWTAYTTALQPGERTARLHRQDMAQLTTPERIDRMRALRAQHAAEADRRGEATKTFYAALTPEQQKTFDAKAHRTHRGGHSGEGHHGKRGGDRHHQHGGAKPATAQ